MWALLLFVLWLPFLQMVFYYFETKPLKGYFAVHAKRKLNDSSWFSGCFQKDYEHYINDTIGFHHDLVRLRNQLDFSLFKKCHSYDVEIGKNNYVMATTHIDAYLGKKPAPVELLDALMAKLKQLNDTLIKMNKTLIVCLAPNKGRFYKELAPGWYDVTKIGRSNYEWYVDQLSGSNVKVIDFNAWFLQRKEITKYPLFTKGGIHWSSYGATLAADSLVKFIEAKRGIDLPDIKFESITVSDSARNTDADISEALNLIWPIKNDFMAYPKLSFNRSGKAKVKTLFIGDSFFFNIDYTTIPKEVFDDYSFWYYNKEVKSFNQTNGKIVDKIYFSGEIYKHDVIVLVSTEINLDNLGWGFIQRAWDALCNNNEERVEYYSEKIKSDTAWYNSIIVKAKKNKKTVEQQLKEDAWYSLWLESQ